jgi:L-seryl-tRNA(Ser) seleniumtransferase
VVQKRPKRKPEAPSRRDLPAVGTVLASRPFAAVVRRHGPLATTLLREALAETRSAAAEGRIAPEEVRRRTTAAELARDVEERARALSAPAPRVVLNASGIVVHTNLGRGAAPAGGGDPDAPPAAGFKKH